MCKQVALYVGCNYQSRRHIEHSLGLLGFGLHKAPTIQVARKLLKKYCYRLLLIHFDTVNKEIFEFCSWVHSDGTGTIIIVLMTDPGVRIEERLFDSGVNDVVTGKQATARVLTKRIRAHLRNSKSSWPQTNVIRLKDTVIDFDRREVWCNGNIRKLPGLLADLLKYFLDNPSRVISREELWKSHIWVDSICSSPEDEGKTFDVNVSKLRKLIESDPARPQIIISVRGAGWKLANGTIG